MTHLTNTHTKEITSITAFNIPQDQIVYGTKFRQDEISSDLVKYKDNPNLYLTKSLNEVLNSALSRRYTNNSTESKINVIHGLTMSILDTYVDSNYTLIATIHPGVLIMDEVLIKLIDITELRFNIPIEALVNKTYDHIIISAEYLYLKNNPIKFTVWLYDNNNQTLFNDVGQVWDNKQFIFKTISLEIDSNLNVALYKCNHEQLIIKGKSYSTQFYNYYQWLYIRILLEMFDDYAGYVIDIPFIPPIPKAAVYGITGLFV